MSKRYSSYKYQPKVFKLLLNFLPNGPHKLLLWIFESLSLRFLTIFFENFKVTIVAYGESKNLNYLNKRPRGLDALLELKTQYTKTY